MEKQLPLILIVDDEADLRETYKIKFEKSGFRVLVASDGEEGVSAAIANHPDIVLMDVNTPVLDGVAAHQRLKENPKTKDIKVVFLTGFTRPSHEEMDKDLAKGIGASDFILKGIDLDELVDAVRMHLAA